MIWSSLNELDEEVKITPKLVEPRVSQHQPSQAGKSDWALSADVYKKGANLIVKINLPGVNPENLDIAVSMDSVKVAGVSEDEEEIDGRDYFIKEMRRGSFERTIKLPIRIEMDKAEADFSKGTLRITVPIRQENLVNKIKVKSN